MKTIKVSEASGPMLDWCVAKCEGAFDLHQRLDWHNKPWAFFFRDDEDPERVDKFYLNEYEPSTDWSACGPIIEREKIGTRSNGDGWVALHINPRVKAMPGSTPLIAAMRCHVVSKLGDEVEIPSGLFGE